MNAFFLDFPGLRKRMQLEPRFGVEFLKMAERLNLDPNAILSVISIETAGTFDPAIQNPLNPNPDLRATGLIQFTPDAAASLGTGVPALRKMSAVEQLQYVERFFQRSLGKIRRNEPGDYYMAVFMPAFIGAPVDKVLGRLGDMSLVAKGLTYDAVYRSNVGFDRAVPKHDFFTVADVWQTTLSRIASAKLRPPLEVTAPGPLVPAAPGPPLPSLPSAWRSSGGRCDLPVLRIGAKGSAVTLAQVLLGEIPTGVYSDAMGIKVRALQEIAGLDNDAVIGPMTWQKLAAL